MNKRIFERFKYQLPAILWAIFILGVCTYPFNGLPSGGFFGKLPMDKLVHGFLFFVLGYLLVKGRTKQQAHTELKFKIILSILTIAFVYGILIELIQHYFTLKRTGDIWDVVADGLGCGIGIWLFHFITRKRSF